MVDETEFGSDPANQSDAPPQRQPPRHAPTPDQAQQSSMRRAQIAQRAQRAKNPNQARADNPAALNWLAAATDFFYPKPQTNSPPAHQVVDPFQGRQLRLEFINGSRRGTAGRPVDETPAVRLTAGGRPIARALVKFEVSKGDLGNGATAAEVVTNPGGIAQLPAWTLGDAGPHLIAAEFRAAREERTVNVTN